MKKRFASTMADNGAPPEQAAVLYAGSVMHHRLKPVGHRFSYGVYSLLIDIERLQEADRLSSLLGVERPGLLSFRSSDHLRSGSSSLREQADEWFRRVRPHASLPSRWLLFCYPRMFGWVFNPISVWFGFDEEKRPVMVVYDVRNTFGGRHAYLAPVEDGQLSDAGIRQQSAKRLHVSPFLGPDLTYNFRVMPPGRALKVRIHETAGYEPLFEASFAGECKPISTRMLCGYLLTIPFLPFKVYAAIHWQALKLWLKGVPFLGARDRHRDDEAPIGSTATIQSEQKDEPTAQLGGRDAA